MLFYAAYKLVFTSAWVTGQSLLREEVQQSIYQETQVLRI